MLTTAKAVWLKSEARSFTNDQGQVVDYYRASILDDEMEPFTLGCTSEVHAYADLEVPSLTPVLLTLNVRRNANGLRCRIEGIQVQ